MSWSVSAQEFERTIIPAGEYSAIIKKLDKVDTAYGERVMWVFLPKGADDTVVGFTSLSEATTAKPAEWARRVLGMSDATDAKFGKAIKDKRPAVNWGPDELEGKPCRIVVELTQDSDGSDRNVVTNVLPPNRDSNLQAAQKEASRAAEVNQAEGPEEDFNDIPF